MLEGWGRVFGLGGSTPEVYAPEVYYRYGKFCLLPKHVGKCVRQYPDLEPDMFLIWEGTLLPALGAINFASNFIGFTQSLTDTLLTTIRFCSRELELRMPEMTLNEAELMALRTEIWQLYEEVSRADIPLHLKDYLTTRLLMMIEAIDDYILMGTTKMERGINEIIGSVVTNPPLAMEVQKTDWGAQFWKVVGKAIVIIKLGERSVALMDKIQELLPHGKP
jgi:hypothetical protein